MTRNDGLLDGIDVDAVPDPATTHVIRSFLFFEAAAFVAAALIHFGVLVEGYEHLRAATAETVLSVALLLGLALTWIRPAWSRGVGIAVQSFALFGTLVGVFAIAIGIGPRTGPDIAYHAGILLALVAGLIRALTPNAFTSRADA